MKIGIAGPIATNNIAHLLARNTAALPHGYSGAPLLATLISSLLARGHEVVAFTTSSDICPTSRPIVATNERFSIHYCPVRRRAFRRENGHWGRAADFYRLEIASLAKAMRDTEPELIHAHWSYEFAQAALDSNLPHLITCHDAPQVVLRNSPDPYRLVRYLMAKRILGKASHLTAVSPYLKNKIERYARVKISVVPNPIQSVSISSVAKADVLDPVHPRIAMVINGWGKLKNPKPALAAFGLLHQEIQGAELVVIGKDFGKNEVAQLWCESQGISDGIRFCGPLPYPDLLAELAQVNLLLHPSLEEAFGMSVAEAMAHGVPVIGGENSGAVPWVVAAAGILVDVRSPGAIKHAMSSLLSNPTRHRECSAFAAERAGQAFLVDLVVDSYEALYREICSSEGVLCSGLESTELTN